MAGSAFLNSAITTQADRFTEYQLQAIFKTLYAQPADKEQLQHLHKDSAPE